MQNNNKMFCCSALGLPTNIYIVYNTHNFIMLIFILLYNKRQQKFNNKMVNRCSRRLYEMVGAKHTVCNDKLYNFNTIINCFRIGTLIQMNMLTRPKTISHQRHTVFDVASLILKRCYIYEVFLLYFI